MSSSVGLPVYVQPQFIFSEVLLKLCTCLYISSCPCRPALVNSQLELEPNRPREKRLVIIIIHMCSRVREEEIIFLQNVMTCRLSCRDSKSSLQQICLDLSLR